MPRCGRGDMPAPKTVLNGTGPPNSLDDDGDFYIGTAADVLYGPKANGSWPAVETSLVGPPGSPGRAPPWPGRVAVSNLGLGPRGSGLPDRSRTHHELGRTMSADEDPRLFSGAFDEEI